jgi:hypothetical protein
MKWILSAALMLLASTAWAQVPREDFERWDSTGNGGVAPPGWSGTFFGYGKDENAHSGHYGASVWNWYFYATGYLMTGGEQANYNDLISGGVPISFKPVRLSGYYRYELGHNRGHSDSTHSDSALVLLMLKRYNTAAGHADTIAYERMRLPAATAYTPFSIDIRDRAPGIDPDSVVIAFVSSDGGFCDSASSGTCLYFTVDDVQLSAASGVPYNVSSLLESARVYPSPVRTVARVTWDALPGREYTLLAYSSAGELVRVMKPVTGGDAPFDRSGLASGVYLLEIRDDAGHSAAHGSVVVE